MRKSNWIVYAVIIIVSLFLLWLWYFLGFYRLDEPLDLVISIIWWAIVAAGIVITWRMEMVRERRARTLYLAPMQVFNSEKGTYLLEPGTPYLPAMQAILQDMRYSFHIEELPDPAEARFVYVVRTKKYKAAGTGAGSNGASKWRVQEQDAEADGRARASEDSQWRHVYRFDEGARAKGAAPGELVTMRDVDTWEGEVVVVARPDTPIPFDNKEQLLAILESTAPTLPDSPPNA